MKDSFRDGTLAEEEESEQEERESLEERREEMRERINEMREQGGPGGGPGGMPGGGGLASMMQQIAGAGGRGGQQNRAMLESMKKLRGDMQEIKEYLRKILENLEEE